MCASLFLLLRCFSRVCCCCCCIDCWQCDCSKSENTRTSANVNIDAARPLKPKPVPLPPSHTQTNQNQKHVRVSWQRQSDAATQEYALHASSAIATRLQASTSRVTSPTHSAARSLTLRPQSSLFVRSFARLLACSLAYLLLPLPNPFCVLSPQKFNEVTR